MELLTSKQVGNQIRKSLAHWANFIIPVFVFVSDVPYLNYATAVVGASADSANATLTLSSYTLATC